MRAARHEAAKNVPALEKTAPVGQVCPTYDPLIGNAKKKLALVKRQPFP
jgi:hypothetical protein